MTPGDEPRCPGCYDSFSGPWCDNCDRWPCTCVTAATPDERSRLLRAGHVGMLDGSSFRGNADPADSLDALRAALEAAERVKAAAIENGGRLTPGAILDTQAVITGIKSALRTGQRSPAGGSDDA
jgi:hypothetical protein